MKIVFNAIELRSMLHKVLSKEVGWNIEDRVFIVHEEALIDVALALIEELKRGEK